MSAVQLLLALLVIIVLASVASFIRGLLSAIHVPECRGCGCVTEAADEFCPACRQLQANVLEYLREPESGKVTRISTRH